MMGKRGGPALTAAVGGDAPSWLSPRPTDGGSLGDQEGLGPRDIAAASLYSSKTSPTKALAICQMRPQMYVIKCRGNLEVDPYATVLPAPPKPVIASG